MSNACFNGDFRQKPNQSFSGVNKNLKRDQLIQQAAHERKQREEFRKHSEIAVKLQSQIRKYLTCKKWHESLRLEFDSKRIQIEDNFMQEFRVHYDEIHYFAIRLIKFYSYPEDRERLIFINKLLINSQNVILNQPLSRLHWLKYVFKFNSLTVNQLLDHFPNYFEQFKLILQAFNMLTNDMLDSKLKNKIWHHLLSNDYMKNLPQIFGKIRSIESMEDGLFVQVYNVLLGQLLSWKDIDQTQQTLLIQNFLRQFLPGLNDFRFLNNILSSCSEKTAYLLSTSNIIKAFNNLDDSIPIEQYTMIVYSVVKLIVPSLHNNTNNYNNGQLINDYLNVLKLFSSRLFAYFRTKLKLNLVFRRKHNDHNYAQNMNDQNSNEDEEDEEEDDDDDDDDNPTFMGSKKTVEDDKLLFYCRSIFSLLNSTDNCNIIIRFIDNHLEKNKNALVSLSCISHLMLFFHANPIHHNRLLHTLAFNSTFLKKLWNFVLNETGTVSPFADLPSTCMQILSRGLLNSSFDWPQFIPHVTIFAALFNYFLQTLDDVEFFNEFLMEDEASNGNCLPYNYSILPFKLDEIISMSSVLRDACISLIELAYQDRRIIHYKINLFGSGVEETIKDEFSIKCWSLLLRNLLRLLRHIYARDIRRKFCPENHWISKRTCITIVPQNFNIAIKQRRRLYQEFRGIKHLNRDEIIQHGSPISVKDVINVTLIQELPFVASFCDRVQILQTLIAHDKLTHEVDFYDIIHNRTIAIRRNYVYEDSFEKFSPNMVHTMKKTIRVQLISALGLEETGVDGGGIFREFLSEALKAAFDPNRGLFKTTSDGLIYPNPSARLLYNNSDDHYYFVGRLLGKAIYEHMLVELPFAPFFLAKILTVNSDIEINHLASLDPVLYKNLISLKNYVGDVSELGLDFTTVVSDFGTNKIEELKPNGSNITVTNQNRIEYIHLMADYKLNKQIRFQCAAFKKGFYNVVNFDWVKMFDTKELQVIISGAQTPIDLEDLMSHTFYTGNYNENHSVIKIFWEVVKEFDENDKRKLLKFVTSCSRPPLMGFKDLCPPFCIQNAGQDPDRLPTSSTCMNLLKLPEINDKKLMREKLIYSINSGSGFELS